MRKHARLILVIGLLIVCGVGWKSYDMASRRRIERERQAQQLRYEASLLRRALTTLLKCKEDMASAMFDDAQTIGQANDLVSDLNGRLDAIELPESENGRIAELAEALVQAKDKGKGCLAAFKATLDIASSGYSNQRRIRELEAEIKTQSDSSYPNEYILSDARQQKAELVRTEQQNADMLVKQNDKMTRLWGEWDELTRPLRKSKTIMSAKAYVSPPSSDTSPSNPTNGSAGASDVVYTTLTGECYHAEGCSSLRRSKIETTREAAEGRGLRPCSRCSP